MTDFYFIKGGPCIPECLPICDGCGQKDRAKHLPYPNRVAGEYGRGDFTMSNLLSPRTIEHQRLAFVCKPVAVDDTIPMILVPEHHVLTDLFTQVMTTMQTHIPTITNPPSNMAGLTYDVVATVRDKETGEQESVITLDAALLEIDANVNAAKRAPVSPTTAGLFVATGTVVEVGLKILTLPTSALATFDFLSGAITLVAKVSDYQAVSHI